MRITPVILCGGSGTRLWPRSRKSKPKPFLPLLGERTLFQEALDRCDDTARYDPAMVVAGKAHIELIADQASPDTRIIVEPMGKNTAPAIALAAQHLPVDAVMLVCPSDHHIADVPAFTDAVARAARLAAQGHLVAFGIHPTVPETGYGYIRRGGEIEGGYAIDRFVEKPDLETAKSFLADGNYSWNGGIFCFQAGRFLEELASYRPEMAALVRDAVEQGEEDGALFHPDAGSFAEIEGDSIDYAVMERTSHAAMVPVDMGWSDIGNWQALRDVQQADEDGNLVHGPAELVGCSKVMVESDGPRVSVIGLEDVIVVVDGDEVLVTTAAGAQKVGKLNGAANQ